MLNLYVITNLNISINKIRKITYWIIDILWGKLQIPWCAVSSFLAHPLTKPVWEWKCLVINLYPLWVKTSGKKESCSKPALGLECGFQAKIRRRLNQASWVGYANSRWKDFVFLGRKITGKQFVAVAITAT